MSFFLYFFSKDSMLIIFCLLIWNSIAHEGRALKQPALIIIPKYTQSVDFGLILAFSLITLQ